MIHRLYLAIDDHFRRCIVPKLEGFVNVAVYLFSQENWDFVSKRPGKLKNQSFPIRRVNISNFEFEFRKIATCFFLRIETIIDSKKNIEKISSSRPRSLVSKLQLVAQTHVTIITRQEVNNTAASRQNDQRRAYAAIRQWDTITRILGVPIVIRLMTRRPPYRGHN